MKKPFLYIFFVLVSACGLLDAAQGRRGRQPDRAERDYNFLAMVERQLGFSHELLEAQNQSLQDQPVQPRGLVQQRVVNQDGLRRQPRAPQAPPAEVDTRSDRQKLLHSGLSIEEIKRIVRDEQNGNDPITCLEINLDDLSQVAVLPSSPNRVFLAETIRNLPLDEWYEGFQAIQGRRDPYTRARIEDWFLELLGLPIEPSQQLYNASQADAQSVSVAQQQPAAAPVAVDNRSNRQKLLHAKLSIEEIRRIIMVDQAEEDQNAEGRRPCLDPITADEIDPNDLSQVVILPSSPNRVFLADTIRNLRVDAWSEGRQWIRARRDPFNRKRIPDWLMKLLNGEDVPEWFVERLMRPNANLQQELSEAQPPAGNRADRQQHVRGPVPAPAAAHAGHFGYVPQAQPPVVGNANGQQNMWGDNHMGLQPQYMFAPMEDDGAGPVLAFGYDNVRFLQRVHGVIREFAGGDHRHGYRRNRH